MTKYSNADYRQLLMLLTSIDEVKEYGNVPKNDPYLKHLKERLRILRKKYGNQKSSQEQNW
jgi:uncharacterized protein (DUF4213/DUF364 family)